MASIRDGRNTCSDSSGTKTVGKKRIGLRECFCFVPRFLLTAPHFSRQSHFVAPSSRHCNSPPSPWALGEHTYSGSALRKIEIKRHLLKKTAHALHNSKQSDNFAIEIDEKHTLDSFCPRFAGAHHLHCGSPPGLSRRHACFTFISPHYENSDSLFAAPAGTQRLFPPHQRTHRDARHVACGAHRHPSRTHHAH